jgi:hypothetical protein
MRALILRRVGLIEAGAGGPVPDRYAVVARRRALVRFSAATAFRT